MESADFNTLLNDTYERLLQTSIGKQSGASGDKGPAIPATPSLAHDDPHEAECPEATAEAIEAVMDVLISKDIMLEPLQSLDKSVTIVAYDEWAREGFDKEPADRQPAIASQRALIKEIIRLFDSPDAITPAVKKAIFEKMQEIQEHGVPPAAVTAKITDDDGFVFQDGCSVM